LRACIDYKIISEPPFDWKYPLFGGRSGGLSAWPLILLT
jgi:hypothetical protein